LILTVGNRWKRPRTSGTEVHATILPIGLDGWATLHGFAAGDKGVEPAQQSWPAAVTLGELGARGEPAVGDPHERPWPAGSNSQRTVLCTSPVQVATHVITSRRGGTTSRYSFFASKVLPSPLKPSLRPFPPAQIALKLRASEYAFLAPPSRYLPGIGERLRECQARIYNTFAFCSPIKPASLAGASLSVKIVGRVIQMGHFFCGLEFGARSLFARGLEVN
jgi:hypothetical protein